MSITPEERLKSAHERLDAWLMEFDKAEDAIGNALEELCAEVDELAEWRANRDRWCHHHQAGSHQCPDCLTATIKALGEASGRTWKLWEERA